MVLQKGKSEGDTVTIARAAVNLTGLIYLKPQSLAKICKSCYYAFIPDLLLYGTATQKTVTR